MVLIHKTQKTMADIIIHAAYGSVIEDEEGFLYVGFAQGEDETSPYVVFSQSLNGGPVTIELTDEAFRVESGVEKIIKTSTGFKIQIAAFARAKLGWASLVDVVISDETQDADIALMALNQLFDERL